VIPRVVVPFTRPGLQRGVTRAIRDAGYKPTLRRLDSDDVEAYWRLLSDLWVAGDDFVLVEQDIVVREDTLQSFYKCPHSWCAAGYRYLGSPSYMGIGCIRFRADLLRRCPDVMERVANYNYPNHGPKHFCTLDAAMQSELHGRREHVCGHGTVEHLSDGSPSHGCVPGYPGYRFG
jgi:hypothetical protein